MTVARACADGFAHVVVVELASLRDPDATVQLIAERSTSSNVSISRWSERSRSSSTTGRCCSCSTTASTSWCRRSSGPAPQSSLSATHRAGDRSCALGPARRVRPRPRTARRASGWSGRRRGSIRCRRAAVRRPSRRGTSGIPARRAQSGRGGGNLPQARRPASGDRAGGGGMRSIGAEALADRLDQRFALLAGQSTSLDPRHRSLHQLVEWSYELLDPVDQQPSPTWRRSPAASISKQPKSCAGPGGLERPACRDRPGRQVNGAGGRSRGAAVPAAGDVARFRPGATPGDRARSRRSRSVIASGSWTRPSGLPWGSTPHTRGDGSRRSTATSTTSAPPTPAPWPPVTSPSPEGWWPPFASTRSGSALRDCRLGRGHDADGGVRALALSADRARRRCLRAMGARRPRCRNRARPPLDRRRRLARRTVDRPRGARSSAMPCSTAGRRRARCTGWTEWPRPQKQAADRPP